MSTTGWWRPTELRVDLSAIRHNVARLAEVAGTPVCAVVKADAYGHGAVPVARAALAGGAAWLAVALVEEGRELRDAGIDAPVMLLSEPPVAAIDALLAARLTPTVYRAAFLDALDDAAGRVGDGPVAIHLKVDTGMGRVGMAEDEAEAMLRAALASRNVDVDGLTTHLARADEAVADTTTSGQLAAFDRFVALARSLGADPRWVHAANTAGALRHVGARYDLVRPGIGIYGLSPGAEVDAARHGLRPAAALVSAVSHVKRVTAGTPVSYGHRWAAPVDGFVATVPVGYADGVRRGLGGHAEVVIGGVRRPVAGTVTMDQLLAWCGDDRPEVGDEVVLLGRQGAAEVRAEEWATHLGTITYEVLTGIAARVPRVHVDGQESD